MMSSREDQAQKETLLSGAAEEEAASRIFALGPGEGELTFYVGDQTTKAQPGLFLFGPKDIPHAFTVDSGPARLLFILSPAGFEELVREMGEPARALTLPPQPEAPPSEAEMQQMAAMAAQHGVEFLGPPPGP